MPSLSDKPEGDREEEGERMVKWGDLASEGGGFR